MQVCVCLLAANDGYEMDELKSALIWRRRQRRCDDIFAYFTDLTEIAGAGVLIFMNTINSTDAYRSHTAAHTHALTHTLTHTKRPVVGARIRAIAPRVSGSNGDFDNTITNPAGEWVSRVCVHCAKMQPTRAQMRQP